MKKETFDILETELTKHLIPVKPKTDINICFTSLKTLTGTTYKEALNVYADIIRDKVNNR